MLTILILGIFQQLNMVQNQKNVLMTGGTGSFGRFLAQEILKDRDVNLTLLVRASSTNEALGRVSELFNPDPKRVRVYRSDLTKEYLGLSKHDYDELCNKTTHLVHSAASTRFNLSLDEARLSNVTTTEHVIEFSKKCSKLLRFGYLSTVFVAGKCTGLIKEDDFEHDCGFSNSYQETKYEAELLVRKNIDRVPTVIFRPPFIVSPHSLSDSRKQVSFLSVLISFIAKGYLPYVPGSEKVTIDLVNAHDAARTIVKLLFKDKLSYTTYHITNGSKALDLKTFHKIIENKTGKDIPIEYCGNIESFNKRLNKISKTKPELMNIYKKFESFLLEPAYPKIFDNQHTLSEMKISRLGENPTDTLELVFKGELWNSLR
jgi:thioester reductase-like protein